MLKAVIFDFDGVITDSEILHFRTFNQVLAPHGIVITQKQYYKDYLGLNDRDLFNLLIETGRLKFDVSQVEELIKQKNRIFENLAKSEGKIIEGVRDFLETLRRNNILMAICSGALLAEIELILEDAKLRPFFDVIVSAEHVRKGKPDPEGFILTLKRLNESTSVTILPEQCVVIEDSHWGLKAAAAAGIHTVAITNSYDAEQLEPSEKTISHLSELSIEHLQGLCR
ncbi:MAG: HAD family hydrolase [Planctomycetota bacterium]|jgi:beta-phosphoglucomutase